jgi:hypothetical protein
MLKKFLGLVALLLSFNSHAVYRMYLYESEANVILSGSGVHYSYLPIAGSVSRIGSDIE